MKFQVKGEFKAGKNWEKFTKEVDAHNEKFAIEKIYSTIGSKHRLKRNMIKIKEVKEV
ncbi:MAG: 50S ribosomal protein L18Ae [Candidatus Syntropharchaeia archaeon]